MSELPERGDHLIVNNLDGDQSKAVVVGSADEPASEYQIPSNDGTRPLTQYWFGHDVQDDEPVVEIRYWKGVDIDGDPVSYSQTVYGVPASAIVKVIEDG